MHNVAPITTGWFRSSLLHPTAAKTGKGTKEGLELPAGSITAHPALPHINAAIALDQLMSMIPFILAIFLKDANTYAGLIIATFFSAVMLFKRITMWSPRLPTWPMLEITSFCMYTILLGVVFHRRAEIQHWLPTMTSGVMASVTLISIIIRRPCTAHYMPIGEDDSTQHGSVRLSTDPLWHSTNDLATGAWAAAFTCICLLSLLPQLRGDWFYLGNWLNFLYNYLGPVSFIASAILITQLLFSRYQEARRSPQSSQRPIMSHTNTPPDIEADHTEAHNSGSGIDRGSGSGHASSGEGVNAHAGTASSDTARIAIV